MAKRYKGTKQELRDTLLDFGRYNKALFRVATELGMKDGDMARALGTTCSLNATINERFYDKPLGWALRDE